MLKYLRMIRVLAPLWKDGPGSYRQLALVGLVTAATMTGYERVKDILFPHLSLWDSHSITIVVAAITSLVCTHWSIQRNALLVEAVAQSNAQSVFLAGMSREFRTPLNVVLGMTEVLAETDLSIEQRRYLTMMSTNGDELRKLIDDILEVPKIKNVLINKGDRGWMWQRICRATPPVDG
jgi:signal transduction histidine kinase